MATTVRAVQPGDEARILELTGEFLQLSPYTLLFPPKAGHLEDLYQRLVKWGQIFVAVNSDDYIVGVIAGAVVPHAMNGEPYAEGVIWYVDKGHRGGRTGPNLLGVFLEWASTNGATVLKMSAPFDSPVGKLLVASGFAPLETHFVIPLRAPTTTVPVKLEGVTRDDLQQAVRERQGQGGRSGEPQPTHRDGTDAADSARADDGKDSPA